MIENIVKKATQTLPLSAVSPWWM